jgi:hypothetical protein
MYQFRFVKPGHGEIQIDDFIESFESDHHFFSMAEYEAQWQSASKRLIKGLPALFFTSITDPKNANFFRCWECHPIDGKLIFHDRILFLKDLTTNEPFDLNNPHRYVLPYSPVTEDGDAISEWITTPG